LLFLAWRRDCPHGMLFLPALFMVALVLYGVHVLVPRAEAYKSPRPFCEEIVQRIEQGGRWCMFRFYRAAYVYYTDSFTTMIEHEHELRAFLRSPVFSMVVMEEKEFDRMKDAALRGLPVLARRQIGHRTVVLVANRAEP
jgi:hypothetical protein